MRRGAIELGLRKQLGPGAIIAGVDEVGRGCLAGPVCAGAAILDYERLAKLSAKDKDLIRDSKTLSAKQREAAKVLIDKIAIFTSVAMVQVKEIEALGIVKACFLAMQRALVQFPSPISMLLVDGKFPMPNWPGPQQAVIEGDMYCYCIAAGAILAKLSRDAFMREESKKFPAYGFDRHVGYGTREHLAAIEKDGILPIHRRNFAPIRSALSPLNPS